MDTQSLVQDWTGDFIVENQQAREDSKATNENENGRGTIEATVQDWTDEFAVEQDEVKVKQDAEAFRETDPHRLNQRQRQIDFGKNTIGYQRLTEAYPVRHKRPKTAPRTPDVHKKCSKRAFDGLVRQWRRRLHEWDLPDGGDMGGGHRRGHEAPRDPRIPLKGSGTSGAKRLRVDDGDGGSHGRDTEGHISAQKKQQTRKPPAPSRRTETSITSACGVEIDFANDDAVR